MKLFRRVSLVILIAVFGLFAGSALAENEASVKTPSIEDAPLVAKLVVDAHQKAEANDAAAAAAAVVAAAGVADAATVAPQAKVLESKIEVSKLAENQIPVLTSSKELKKASGPDLQRIFITLGVFTVLFAALAFGLKRWMARKVPGNQNTKIRILTQHALGPKKSLAIIQVAGEAILIGITDQNISVLKTLALIDDEVPEETPNRFDSALSDYEDEAENSRGSRRSAQSEPEEFTMRGLNEIRDTVSSRLRGMKNF